MNERDTVLLNRCSEQAPQPRSEKTIGEKGLAIAKVLLGVFSMCLLISACVGGGVKQPAELTGKDPLPRDVPHAGGGGAGSPADSSNYPRSITWRRSLDGAIEEASASRKLIVVDVFTSWCGWCKRMDETTYTDPRVAALARSVVFLKLDAEDGSEGERFAHKAGVRGYPTTVILNSSGRVIDSRTGYIQSGPAFVSFVETAKGAVE